MEINISTPAIIFSTVSLLFIAFTTRFVALSNLVRGLKSKYLETQDAAIMEQIANLRKRITIIRNMQLLGITSLMFTIVSIMFLFFNEQRIGGILFFISLIFLILAMISAAREILISVNALNIELSSIEQLKDKHLDESDTMLGEGIKKISKQFFQK